MKWHDIIITITAALLITLPFHAMSAHCAAQGWNQILKSQTDLDQSYNSHAQKFNQFLDLHQQQPFLYQEFTSDEIQQFWRSNKPTFHDSMKAQIDASLFVINKIQLERATLNRLTEQVTEQILRWQVISQHCKEIDNQSNTIASWNYAQLNQALNLDISLLLSKLKRLEQRYRNEVDALRKAMPTE